MVLPLGEAVEWIREARQNRPIEPVRFPLDHKKSGVIPSLQVGDLEGFRDKDEKVFRNLTETIYTDVPDHKPVWEAIVRLPEVCEPCASISEEKGSIAFPGSPPLMVRIHYQ